MLVAAGIQHDDSVGDQQRGKRDVLGDDEIAGLCVLCDVLVGHIRPAIDAHGGHEGVSGGGLESLVGDKYRLDSQPLRRAEDKIFHVARGGVCIYPDLQVRPFTMAGSLLSRVGWPLSLDPSPEIFWHGPQQLTGGADVDLDGTFAEPSGVGIGQDPRPGL